MPRGGSKPQHPYNRNLGSGITVLAGLLPRGTRVVVGSEQCVTQSLVWEDRNRVRKVVVSGQRENPVLLEEVKVVEGRKG